MPLPPAERTRDAGARVLHADPAHVAVVVATARAATPLAGHTVVVGVDGRSGSGKTVLATAVADALECPVVHLDDVFPGWDGLAAGVALATQHVLVPLARGTRAAYPTWDWGRDRPGPIRRVEPSTYLVLEGCGALVPPAVLYAAVRIWVDAPDALRRERALARDGEVYAPHWDRWAAQEDAAYSMSDPRDHAHVVLRTLGA